MATATDPRVTVRLSEAELAVVERAASAAGVKVGTMMRFCAVRWAAVAAANVACGRLSRDAVRMPMAPPE